MNKMLRSILVVTAVFCLFAVPLRAQPATATWPLTSTTGQSVQLAGQILADNEALSKDLVINAYTGPNNSQRIKMGTWPVNQLTQIDSVYFQYAVRPQVSYTLVVDSVVMSLGANSTQDMMANIYYSKDPTFAVKTQVGYVTSVAARLGKPAGVFLNNTLLDVIRATPNVTVNVGENFYLRVYPWVDSSSSVSGKYVCPQNVVVYATAVPIPVSAGATWPLMANGSAVVNGLISASNISYDGVNLYHYGYGANGDRWTNHLPSNGAWPAETSPNFSRYAQFSVGPQTGGTFYVNTIQFSQVVEFTNALRVAVYYSNDSTFATSTFLADTVVPAAKSTYQYAVNDTIPTGQKIYLRFFPYDVTGDPSWKLVDVDSVMITGVTTGLAILPPTVTTTAASSISTTFFTTGGNVSADGGGPVTQKGVCWNTTGSATTADAHTTDGTGIGSFTSSVSGLTPATTYYVRAYAVNIGGTSYGSEIIVPTLAAVVAPTVTTTAASSVLVTTAISGGNVTAWGGDTVRARGVCWNTAGSPTLSDAKTVDGNGIGSFASGLTALTAATTYHVRAYATNTAGTGYGSEVTFTTQTPSPDTTVVVAKDGSGRYTTLQAAFRDVPLNYTGTWTIFVKKGIYYEKDTLASGKVNVHLIGEDRDSTVITFDDYADSHGSGNPGTSGCFTVAIDASDFTAKNITIQNTYWPNRYGVISGTQGVALRTQGDRHEYINCALRGYQDTYYTWGGSGAGRMYHKNCIITGSVDFIFGRNICVFDSCTIVMMKNGGTITAGATDATSMFGYVFRNCTLLADSTSYTDTSGYAHAPISGFYLGRPWQNSPRTVYMHSYEPSSLAAQGWTTMQVNPTLYAEYNCYGPGFTASRGSVSGWPAGSQARQLTNTEAATYSLSTMFAKNSASSSVILYDWMPANASSADDMPVVITAVANTPGSGIPTAFSLRSYPNPFNPSTNIVYDVPQTSNVTLKVYDMLGREIATLVNGTKTAGTYTAVFNAGRLATGIYFVRLQFNGNMIVKRMLLLK